MAKVSNPYNLDNLDNIDKDYKSYSEIKGNYDTITINCGSKDALFAYWYGYNPEENVGSISNSKLETLNNSTLTYFCRNGTRLGGGLSSNLITINGYSGTLYIRINNSSIYQCTLKESGNYSVDYNIPGSDSITVDFNKTNKF